MTVPRVLFVDDEPNVLVGVARALRGRFDVVVAVSGEDALQQMTTETFDVVVSDMRMPVMDGASFLAHAKRLAPDTVRLVMSGHSDLDACIRAINHGHIFQFLVKPVTREALVASLESAVEQRRLVLAEKELLERTLTGAVDALSEGLALTSPIAFGRSRRLKHLVTALAEELKLAKKWPLEVAAMLSQLGAATLPPDTLQRWYANEPLSEVEREMVQRVGSLSCQQLRHIPRLEPVLELISVIDRGEQASAILGLEGRVLQVASELELRLFRGQPLEEALVAMAESLRFDPTVVSACRRLKALLLGQGPRRAVSVAAVSAGMVLADDVRAKSGALLIARGHAVSEGLVVCLRNFAATVGVREPIQVISRGDDDEGEARVELRAGAVSSRQALSVIRSE